MIADKPSDAEIKHVVSILNRLEPNDVININPELVNVVNKIFSRHLKKIWLGEEDVVSYLREQQSNKDLLKKLEKVHNIIQQTYADNVESARAAGINSMREARTAEVNSKGIGALTTQASFQTLIHDFQNDLTLLQLQNEIYSSSTSLLDSSPYCDPPAISSTSVLQENESGNGSVVSVRYADAMDFQLPKSEVVSRESKFRAGGLGKSRGRRSTFKVGRIRGLYDEVDTDVIDEQGEAAGGDVRRSGVVYFVPRATVLRDLTASNTGGHHSTSTSCQEINETAEVSPAISGSEKHEVHAGQWLCYVKDNKDGLLRACALRTIVDLAGALENINRPLQLHNSSGYNFPCFYMIGGRKQKWALLGGEVDGLCGETAITVKLATSTILSTRSTAPTSDVTDTPAEGIDLSLETISEKFCPKIGDFRLNCNVCKSEYLSRHPFYHQLCPRCGDFNYMKRLSTADLKGYVCLVTGGRVRIGYQIVLKLLRAGATVLTTTRWVYDAANRYSQESDFDSFRNRLQIHFLELSDIPSVELYCSYLMKNYQRIHILINNAAQTITRPENWHSKMNLLEKHSLLQLSREIVTELLVNEWNSQAMPTMNQNIKQFLALSDVQSVYSTAGSTVIPAVVVRDMNGDCLLNEETTDWNVSLCTPTAKGFATGELVMSQRNDATNQWVTYDESGQPLDSAGSNSWSRRLHDVSATEVAETMAVNSIAPFLLTSKLKQLLSPIDITSVKSSQGPLDNTRRNSGMTGVMGHVVNVTSLEGKFNVGKKSTGHPHTNMGKAALNMLTLTSARDYLHCGIYMNAVDTGWVTDMAPGSIGNRSKVHETFVGPPLDEIDGAARVLDPIFSYVSSDGSVRYSGNFLKDYMKASW